MKPITESWVNLAIFKHEADARALEARLRAQGFEVRTHDDHTLQRYWFLAPPRATFRVQIGARTACVAEDFIETESSAGLLARRAIHCPACRSLKIEYPQMTRRFTTPTLLLDMGIIFHIIDHQAFCEDCQNVWSLRRHDTEGDEEKIAI